MADAALLQALLASWQQGQIRFLAVRPDGREHLLSMQDLHDLIEIQNGIKSGQRHRNSKGLGAMSLESFSAWLAGQFPPHAYIPRLARDHTGALASVTTSEVVASLAICTDQIERDFKKVEAGHALLLLGWRRRYITHPCSGQRERRYFPPRRRSDH